MAGKRTRRTKQEMLTDKIQKVKVAIVGYQEKIDQLEATKAEYEKQLEEINNEIKKAEREKQMNELVDLMEERGYTIEQLKEMMNKPE